MDLLPSNEKTEKPSAIVFDIGGVLLDIDWRNVVGALGIAEDQRYINWINNWPLHHHYEKGLHSSESFFQQLKDYWKLEYDLEYIEMAWNKIFNGTIEGIEKLIDQLPTDIPRYLLSNTNSSHMNFCRHKFPLLERFDRKFFSYEWQARKPEAAFYQSMLKEIKISPAEILFLDDSKENIQAAKKLGIKAELTVHSSLETKKILTKYHLLS